MHFFKKLGVTPCFAKGVVFYVIMTWALYISSFLLAPHLTIIMSNAKLNNHLETLQMLSIEINSLGRGKKQHPFPPERATKILELRAQEVCLLSSLVIIWLGVEEISSLTVQSWSVKCPVGLCYIRI